MAVPPPYLVARYRSLAGNKEVQLVENGLDFSQLGDVLGEVATGLPASKTPQMRSLACKYAGQIFMIGATNVWAKANPTVRAGAYTSVLTLIIPNTTLETAWSGLHPVTVGGEPRLVGFYITTTSDILRAVIYNPLTNMWSLGAVVDTNVTISNISDVRVHNNLIYCTGDQTNVPRTMIYDPLADSYTGLLTSHSTGNNLCGSMFVHKNRLLAIGNNGINHTVSEFVAGAWSVVRTLSVLIPSGSNLNSRAAAESIAGVVIAVLNTEDAGGDGFKALRLDDNFNETDISTTVLPVALRTATDGGPGLVALTARVSWLTDMVTDPTTPRYWLVHAPDGGEGDVLTMFSWAGIGAQMQVEDLGGNAFLVMPAQGPQYGGSSYWSDAGFSFGDCLIVGRLAIADGVRLSFRAWNDAGPADKTARIYFSLDGSAALTLATLKDTATGGTAIRNGNTVEQINADGVTTYTVNVSFSLSGITPGQRVQFYLQLEDTTP